jgi:DNA-binding NtrC family response regulator
LVFKLLKCIIKREGYQKNIILWMVVEKHRSTKKALLIDDDERILDSYSSLLRKEGYQVVTAHSGMSAFEEFCQESFDLIITNLAMKAGRGPTILGMIKALFPRVPLIVFTNARCAIAQTFVPLLGTCTFIKKPCSGEILVSCIRNASSSDSTRCQHSLEAVQDGYG